MKKLQTQSIIVPNLHELDQLPFLKRQTHHWQHFKQKQKFVPALRDLTYQHKDLLAQIFVFAMQQQKGKKAKKQLVLLTEKEIATLEQLYQLLNENQEHTEFSRQVQKIKQFQDNTINFVKTLLSTHLLKFQQHFLNFNVYLQQERLCLKANFNHYNYQLEFSTATQKHQKPKEYCITHPLVLIALKKKYQNIAHLAKNIPLDNNIDALYKQFYDDLYFLYDQFVLKLQVFHNYPLLRLKNYLPVKLTDDKTGQPLVGPIFSSANQECMYNHFIGYNADTIKMVEGDHCQHCQIFIEQLQQNELLMTLRDNPFNPNKSDLYYCPQYNRFKLLYKIPAILEDNSNSIVQEKTYLKTCLKYLNYSHFKINLKKMTNKNRVAFNPTEKEEIFPLSFNFQDRNLLIIDPARGRYCQHHAFTDLRLYYLNHNPENNTYQCPVPNCKETMTDGDILYLKQVIVLVQYAKFKCQQHPQLTDSSTVFIDNVQSKLFVTYKVREQGSVLTKTDQLIDFYKTLVDPYIPFPQYTLGIKQKQRKQRINDYIFGGLKEQMQEQYQMEQESDEQENE